LNIIASMAKYSTEVSVFIRLLLYGLHQGEYG
jgi:hypothetical protein